MASPPDGTRAREAPAPGYLRRLVVGFGCNNACLFCAQGQLRSLPAEPDFALDTVVPGDLVALVGGEPTLDPTLLAKIAACLERGAARVTVQTNGRRLAYATYARELASAGAGRLFLDVSLQGATREMHDFHTSTEGSFAQTVTGLRQATAAAIPTGISVVVTRSNYRHLGDIVRVAHAVGAKAIRPVWAERVGTAVLHAAGSPPPVRLAKPYLVLALREAGRLGLTVTGPLATGAAEGPDDPRFPFAGLGFFVPERV